MDRLITVTEKIYQAVSSNVSSVQVSGISRTNTIEVDFGDDPIIMDNKTYILEVLNVSFVNSMPNIKPPRNTIKYGSSTLTIPTGRYSFKDLFSYIDDGTSGEVKFEMNTLTAKVSMNNTAIVQTTDLLKDLIGFTSASYAVGTHIAEKIFTIDDYSSVFITCDQIKSNHNFSYYGVSSRIRAMYSFSLVDFNSYQTISLGKSNAFVSTISITSKLDRLRFSLLDEHGRPLNFGETESEFRILCNIRRMS